MFDDDMNIILSFHYYISPFLIIFRDIVAILFLTSCCMNFVFRQFFRYISRQVFIIYRLIDATLIGNFFPGPLLF